LTHMTPELVARAVRGMTESPVLRGMR
jgi:hypothetical protein